MRNWLIVSNHIKYKTRDSNFKCDAYYNVAAYYIREVIGVYNIDRNRPFRALFHNEVSQIMCDLDTNQVGAAASEWRDKSADVTLTM